MPLTHDHHYRPILRPKARLIYLRRFFRPPYASSNHIFRDCPYGPETIDRFEYPPSPSWYRGKRKEAV
jgi:hypothetical protein